MTRTADGPPLPAGARDRRPRRAAGMTNTVHGPFRWCRALLLLALVPTIACSQSSPTSDLLVSSDSALQELADGLLQDISERSGLPFAEPVHVEWRSEEELSRYLLFKLESELPEGEVERIRDSYALLGLVPTDLDLAELFLELYTEQVAGFYEPDSVALYVRSGQDEEAVETVLVHELVHAGQDQVIDLASLTDRDLGNDRQVAAQAAIEGHATLVMLEYAIEKQTGAPANLMELPDIVELMSAALAVTASSSPAMAAAPRVVRESLIFPYLQGTGYVHALWRRYDGRPAPFGDLLPHSTEQVLEPERAFGPEPDAPVEIEISGGGDARVTYTNSLGLAEIRILFEEVAGDAEPIRGWEGDEFALVEGAEGQGLVWWSVWEDEPARDAFLTRGRAVAAALTDATLEASVLGGLPAAVLTVGRVPAALEASIVEGR